MILLGKPRGIGILLSPVYRVMRETNGIALHLVDPLDREPIPIVRQLPAPLGLRGGDRPAPDRGGNGGEPGAPGDDQSVEPADHPGLIPVVIAAVFLGRATSVFTAVVSILSSISSSSPPHHTLAVSDWEYFISFIGYLIVALVISILAGRLRCTCCRRSARARRRSRRWPDSRGTSRGRRPGRRSYDRLAEHLRQYTGGPAIVLVPGSGEMVRAAGDLRSP